MYMRGDVHVAERACCVLLLFFSVCPCPSVAVCVLPAARASLQGLGLGGCGLSRDSVSVCGWSQLRAVGSVLTVLGLLHGMRVQTPRLSLSAERGKMEKVPHGARRFFFINKGIWGQLEHE